MYDEKDEAILTELQKNARNTTKNIAIQVKMPRITVHDRIQKMIKNGIIKKFSVIPDYEKIGLTTTVFVFIATNPYESLIPLTEITKKISTYPGVYEIHIVSGEYDLLIKVRGKSFDDVGKNVVAKIRQIKGIGRTFTCPCFTSIKEEV
jgi:DNA-binding Lrp family transcriptional regulator